MELLLLLGFLSFAALFVLGVASYLHQRREGTIVAVSVPYRSLPRPARRETTAHR